MANNEESAPVEPLRPFWRRRKTWVIVGICLFLVWWSRRVPLPSDEEMIAHFQAHRAEFEELVRRYRTFAERENWPELKWPREEEGTKELLRQAKVTRVNYLSLGYWLPGPYSLATARQVKEMNDACFQDAKRQGAGGEKTKFSTDCRLRGYQYGVLEFDPESRYARRFSLKRLSLRFGTVWKTYLHFPEPPRIEDGYLLGPMETDGTYRDKKRAFSSLDYYPLNLKMDECVYRPIDVHWFITLCSH